MKKIDIPRLYRNYVSDEIPLKTLILLQDSTIPCLNCSFAPEQIIQEEIKNLLPEALKNELEFLYKNLRKDTKITLVNREGVSDYIKYSNVISQIIRAKPLSLKLIIIASPEFDGEDIHLSDLAKKFSDRHDISFVLRDTKSTSLDNTLTLIDTDLGSLTDYLKQQKLLKIENKKVA